MKKIATGLLILIYSFGYTQITKKEEKTITKAIALYDEKKYAKAIKKIKPVLETHKYNKSLWDINVEFYYKNYLETYNSMSFLLKSLNDLEIKNDDGTSSKISITSNNNFGYDDFIEQCYINTRLIENATKSSIYLRNYLVDTPVDTGVSSEAIAAFNGAEVEFQKRNFTKAIELYNKALDIEPDFYKATMYLGDCHWADGRPAKAIEYFKKAVKIQPALLEPRKYVADAYIDLEEWDKASVATIEGITTFPDSDMFRRMRDITYKTDTKFDNHWMPRDFELNNIKLEQESIAESPWDFYREAKNKIKPFCDEYGVIIKANDLTKQHYMETYCWEYMLKNTQDKQFDFAKKAMNGGYLDCYTLVSMFHISLHEQFKDFAKNNASKIKDYFNLMLISE